MFEALFENHSLTPAQARELDAMIGTLCNGQRQSFSNMTLDGINIQDNYIRTESLDYTPNSSADEPGGRIHDHDPECGILRPDLGSSQVSMVTPSGTNHWHGEGFWYYRTGTLAANDWFNDANGIAKPNLLQNQGGGDIGGPVIKDKLFIYGAYELYRFEAATSDGYDRPDEFRA